MDNKNEEFTWEDSVRKNFDLLIGKIPIFLRDMAKEKVAKRAIAIVKEKDLDKVSEKEMVDAFFDETPFGFHGPLKCDMEEFGIDYEKYGYSK